MLTGNNGALLVLSILVLGLAGVGPEVRGFDSGNGEGVAVASVVDDVGGRLQGLAVLVPRDLSLGRGVDDADHLSLVALGRVDVGLLVLDLGSVCKKSNRRSIL